MSDKISMEQLLTQAAGGDIAPEPVEPVEDAELVGDNDGDIVEATAESKAETNVEPISSVKETKETKANPMKEVRDKYQNEKGARERLTNIINQYSKGDYDFKLKDFTNEDGLDYASLQEAMENADRKVKADTKGITPEVQAELERIDKEKLEIQKQKLQISMDRALTNMQLELGIKSADVNNFFKDAMASKKNPYQWLAQGGTLMDLYNIVYADKIVERRIKDAIEKERTTWEADAAKRKTPIPNPAKTTAPGTAEYKDGVSMEELLAEAASRKR
jgi:bifunctional DNA-binding transcriptional regulator/antitoxin component of YhaV-PrlF toxin-antitoxin module